MRLIAILTEEWLQRVNRELSGKQVPHMRRPFEAISVLSREQNCAVHIPSAEATLIFAWFEKHSPEKSHHIGSLYTATYYTDAHFWKIDIPIVYGSVQLNALDALKQMPAHLLEEIKADKRRLFDYVSLWADALDYAFGIDEAPRSVGFTPFAKELTDSGDRDLRATVRLLTEDRQPNVKALETARMSTEIFLKAFLTCKEGMSEQLLRKILDIT